MAEDGAKKRGGGAWQGTLLLMALSAAGGYWYSHQHPTSTAAPEVRQGHVSKVSGDGEAFVLVPDSGSANGAGTSYGVAPHVTWYDATETAHMGTTPPCLAPLSHGQHVSVGVVHFKSENGKFGSDAVVWIKCV